MPAPSPILAWTTRVGLFAAVLPLLVDCGPKTNEFAPPCPRPAFLADAASIDQYRPSSAPGGHHDLTDLVLHGRVVALSGSCQPGDKKTQLATTVVMTVELTRGPAMQGRDTNVPAFLAVTDGNSILDKRIYPIQVTFPPNVDRLTLNSGELNLVLPITPTKSGAAYMILAGFQLSPDELRQTRGGANQ
jgi:hypothetical protein